jgi:hypothetical protein
VNVTTNPTAEWISRQITEPFPWDHAPRYLIRDRFNRDHIGARDGASSTLPQNRISSDMDVLIAIDRQYLLCSEIAADYFRDM